MLLIQSGNTLNSVSGRSTSPASTKPAFNMSSNAGGASGGTKLAQEIHDEFLVCKICLDSYKSPKCLSCLHTFCEQCIDNHVNSESSYKKYSDYREFTCPLCRKRTQLPVGGVKKLPDNFLVSSLTEVRTIVWFVTTVDVILVTTVSLCVMRLWTTISDVMKLFMNEAQRWTFTSSSLAYS